MAAFDSAAYRTDVIASTTRTHASAHQRALDEMKDPMATRPSAFDTVFLYQIAPGMSDEDITARLKDVAICWANQFLRTRIPAKKAVAAAVRKLHGLLIQRNPLIISQQWWFPEVELVERTQVHHDEYTPGWGLRRLERDSTCTVSLTFGPGSHPISHTVDASTGTGSVRLLFDLVGSSPGHPIQSGPSQAGVVATLPGNGEDMGIASQLDPDEAGRPRLAVTIGADTGQFVITPCRTEAVV